MKVREILEKKGRRVVTCHADNSLLEALAIFSANKIGSLLVVDANDTIQGIIAPRDILLVVLSDMEKIKELKVHEIMTTDLIVAGLDDDIDYIQAIMTENRIRHIPILEGAELKGLVSIGDVVKAQVREKEVENRYLKEYIEGKYPA
ncbi:MAG TPA: CBS domain-containing protein [Desulfopila sp.]|nr:CBS domain-containing protein [Desulfopila sp.]